MNKDALLATGIGIFIGLAIAGIVLAAPVFLRIIKTVNIPKIASQPKSTESGSTGVTLGKTTGNENELSVDSPLDESVEQNQDLLISGTAPAGSYVVVQGMTDDTVTVANDQGSYAAKVTLSEGINELTITNYQKSEQKSILKIVYFTTQSL